MFRKGVIISRGIGAKKKRFVDSGAVKRIAASTSEPANSQVNIVACDTTPEEDMRFIEEQMASVTESSNVTESSTVSIPLMVHSSSIEAILPEDLSNIIELPEPEKKEIETTDDSSYYVVVDFEATCFKSERVPREDTEIIEFAAVLVDKLTLSPVAEFCSFVRPAIHPELDQFCIELTSITQDMVDGAPSFPTVLRMFSGWLAKFKGEKTFCSWGDYDKNQLSMECERHSLEYPFVDDHLNLKKMFSRARGTKKGYGVGAALKNLGLEFEGTQHRGIDDARNIARLLTYVIEPS